MNPNLQIKSAVHRVEAAEQNLKRERSKLRTACHEAQAAGLAVSQIAREAKLSRQAIYDILAGR